MFISEAGLASGVAMAGEKKKGETYGRVHSGWVDATVFMNQKVVWCRGSQYEGI